MSGLAEVTPGPLAAAVERWCLETLAPRERRRPCGWTFAEEVGLVPPPTQRDYVLAQE